MLRQVVLLLQGILAFHEAQFTRHLQGFYPLFVDLMHCDSLQIRQTLRDIFSNRISSVLQQRQAEGGQADGVQQQEEGRTAL